MYSVTASGLLTRALISLGACHERVREVDQEKLFLPKGFLIFHNPGLQEIQRRLKDGALESLLS